MLGSTDFNTSHVVVYPYLEHEDEMEEYNFNTSHVVVYPFQLALADTAQTNFNTSHVVVYPCISLLQVSSSMISIHLML